VSDAPDWGWQSQTIKVDEQALAGYVMHSSPNPKIPGDLCRWAIYKMNGQTIVIALNGRVFGYERKGSLVKVQKRIERIADLMQHVPMRRP